MGTWPYTCRTKYQEYIKQSVDLSDSRQDRSDRMTPVRSATLTPSECELRTSRGWGNDSGCARSVDTACHIGGFHICYGVGGSNFTNRRGEFGRTVWRWTVVDLATNNHLVNIAVSEHDMGKEGEKKHAGKNRGFHA